MARSKNPTNGMSMRNRTKMQGAGGNTCIVKSTKVVDLGVANASGILYGGITMDPINAAIATYPVASIAGAYEFYRIRSASVKVIPTGGSQAPGSFQHCFVDNSELMSVIVSGSDTQRSGIITNAENTDTVTLQEMTVKRMDMGRVVARKWFQCNVVLSPTASTTEYDRSIMSMHAYRVAGVTPSAAVNCRLEYDIVYELRGLGYVGPSTFLSLASDYPRLPYQSDDGEWPSDVLLVSRQYGERRYSLYAEPKPPQDE